MELIKTFNNLTSFKDYKYFKVTSYIVIFIMIILIEIFVYFTGGTTAFVHLMYIPIILTVFVFGIKEGIVTSIVAGLVLGPYMPMVVSQGIQQEPRSWMFRIIMFILIVFVVGTLLDKIKNYYDLEKRRAYQDIITGYPNLNKFKEDVNRIITEGKHGTFSLVLFEFKNKDMVSHYVNHDISNKAFMNLVQIADEFFNSYDIYTISSRKFIVVLPNNDYNDAFIKANMFYNRIREPIYIEALPISIIIKGGIVTFPYHSNEAIDIILKLEKALSQVSKSQKSIAIFDNDLEIESRKYYDTLVSLYDYLQDDMFRLAFQPKIRICDKKIIGVEALLRMKDETHKNISIAQLISIAEDAGFLHEITRWVILNTVKQIRAWKDKGVHLNVSINLSSVDLNDCSIIDYTVNCINEYNISPEQLEFELTERSIIEDVDRVLGVLREIKKHGIKISLDDYGTGHNSLKYLVDELFPYNYIKIDKLFIDNINKQQNKSLVTGIIETAHTLGIEVVAEGVETEMQLEILREINCDTVQGYYFSKPLTPDDLFQRYFK